MSEMICPTPRLVIPFLLLVGWTALSHTEAAGPAETGFQLYHPGHADDAAVSAEESDGVVSGDKRWILERKKPSQSRLQKDGLEIQTGRGGTLIYKLSRNPANGWNVSPEATIEIRAKILQQLSPQGALTLMFSNGIVIGSLSIGTNGFHLSNRSFRSGFNFEEWTVFRILLTQWDTDQPGGELFVNGEPIEDLGASRIFSPDAMGKPILRFGDMSSSPSGVGGTSLVDYLKWSVEAAIAPQAN